VADELNPDLTLYRNIKHHLFSEPKHLLSFHSLRISDRFIAQRSFPLYMRKSNFKSLILLDK